MNKTRLETFSDGVFAIVITLLVLNISIPDVPYVELPRALWEVLPRILSYVTSFFLVGLYWIGHHLYFDKIKRVDGSFIFMNLVLLLLISFLPFPTSLIGKYPDQQLPLMLYGLNLLITNAISFLMLLYVYRHQDLILEQYRQEFTRMSFRNVHMPLFIWINSIYVVAIALTWFNPHLSYVLYIVVLVLGLVSYLKRINRMT